jgi:hypothetical protein
MGDEASIVWSVLFGAIGLGYFIYGRKQNRIVALLSGIGLMVAPYFIDGASLIVAVCVAMMILPYFVRT